MLKEWFGWREVIDLGDIPTARGTGMYLPPWPGLWGALGTPAFNVTIARWGEPAASGEGAGSQSHLGLRPRLPPRRQPQEVEVHTLRGLGDVLLVKEAVAALELWRRRPPCLPTAP